MSSYPTTVLSRDPRVMVFTAPNPSPKTLEGSHTYLVGQNLAYIIDPGPRLPEYQAYVLRRAENEGISLRGVLLTHGHPDHAPGAAIIGDLAGVPVWGSPLMTPEAAASGGRTDIFATDERFAVDGDELIAVPSPGHSPDHVAFWTPRAGILFAGDVILGEGTTLIAPPEGNMATYMRTLRRLASLNPQLIAPGHGPMVTDPGARIDEYIRHREQRENQVVRELQRGPATIAELVQLIYTNLEPSMSELAEGSVAAQLEKLVEEGRAARHNGGFRLAERAPSQ